MLAVNTFTLYLGFVSVKVTKKSGEHEDNMKTE